MVCCFSAELSSVEGGHAVEVGPVEEICLEPVYTAFVAVIILASTQEFDISILHIRFP